MAGAGVVVVALVAGFARFTDGDDALEQVRAEAINAAQDLQRGDLSAADAQLAQHAGDLDFAEAFAAAASPRIVGDALGKAGSAAAAADPHTYEITLTRLANTLALATHATVDSPAATPWTTDFVAALIPPAQPAADERAAQDVANSQNLLLLLARGYWSTDVLKAVTAAFWTADHGPAGPAWPVPVLAGAHYAPAPTGTSLSDGALALTAALTANAPAGHWAFTAFQPGTTTLGSGEDARTVGRYTHYLLAEHRADAPAQDERPGMTAVLTALSETAAASPPVQTPEPGTPAADLLVLQSIADSAGEDHGGPFGWARDLAGAIGSFLKDSAHMIVSVLSMAPPPFGVVAGVADAAWSAIASDYAAAGLSLAAAVTGLGFAKMALKAKSGLAAQKAATEADEVAKVADEVRAGAKVLTTREDAILGATRVETSPRLYDFEKDARDEFAERIPGAVTEKRLNPPGCLLECVGVRRADVWDSSTGTAHEIKIGTSNARYALKEIAKDVALRADPASGVRRVEWHFFPDKNGVVGPSSEVLARLRAEGIPYVIHLPA